MSEESLEEGLKRRADLRAAAASVRVLTRKVYDLKAAVAHAEEERDKAVAALAKLEVCNPDGIRVGGLFSVAVTISLALLREIAQNSPHERILPTSSKSPHRVHGLPNSDAVSD